MDSKSNSPVSSKINWTVFKDAHLHAALKTLHLTFASTRIFCMMRKGMLVRSTLPMKSDKSLHRRQCFIGGHPLATALSYGVADFWGA